MVDTLKVKCSQIKIEVFSFSKFIAFNFLRFIYLFFFCGVGLVHLGKFLIHSIYIYEYIFFIRL